MDEIKIWSVETDGASPLAQASAVSSELLLEETLVNNPDLLMPGLRLVGRQTPTEGGPLDLLGVDEDGKLVVFELKRGTLSRDAVAQVIDYASFLDSLDDDTLSQHITNSSGSYGIEKIENFEEWYGDNAQGGGLESLRPIRTILVGLGVDDRTERMVSFLAKNSRMDISLLTFHGFSYEGKTLLARQVSIESTAGRVEGDGPSGKQSRRQKWEQLIDRARDNRVHDLFLEAVNMFRGNWNRLDENPGKSRVGLRMWTLGESGMRKYNAYARVDVQADRVDLAFYPRTVALCPDKFQEVVRAMPFDTNPRGRATNPIEAGTEIQFKFTSQDWQTHKNSVDGLTRAVYKSLLQSSSPNVDATMISSTMPEPTP